jgi:serine/threonine protein kinase
MVKRVPETDTFPYI